MNSEATNNPKSGNVPQPKNLKKARRKTRQRKSAFENLDKDKQREIVKHNKEVFIAQRNGLEAKYNSLLLNAVQASTPAQAITNLENAVRVRNRIDVYNLAIALADKKHLGLIPTIKSKVAPEKEPATV